MQLQVSEDLNRIIAYAREEAMRTGSYGKFYGCSRYPSCKGTRDY